MIQYSSAVLITKNVEGMTRFYRDVLGQELRFDFGRCKLFECGLSVWALAENDPATAAPGIGKGANNCLEVCFETEEFEQEASRILDMDLKLLHGVAEEEWGQRTIRFFDPDGNLVELGESIPCFCRRLFKEGLSLETVAKKTGVSIKNVKEYVGRA